MNVFTQTTPLKLICYKVIRLYLNRKQKFTIGSGMTLAYLSFLAFICFSGGDLRTDDLGVLFICILLILAITFFLTAVFNGK